MNSKTQLLLGTRKGLVAYKNNGNGWKVDRVSFMGQPVSLTYVDPRTSTWWACLDHGHWGCKLHRSYDQGESWTEVTAPKYPDGEEVKDGVQASVRYLWAMAHAGEDKSGQLWIGTEPGGLFGSKDNGDSFHLNRGLWDQPGRKEKWFGGGRDYAGIHSVVVDPRDSDHVFVGISVAGVFETKDGGKTWTPRNKGLTADFLPDPDADVGHDPHLLVACSSNPDVLWQQNHCGIFRSSDGAMNWEDVSQQEGPAKFGFAVAVDDEDPNTAWVVPAVKDEMRIPVDNALCVCRTEDGGKTWQEYRKGLPQRDSYDIVFRHALDKTGDTLVFGTTTGNLYLSNDRGESWETVNNNLAMIYSVEFAP